MGVAAISGTELGLEALDDPRGGIDNEVSSFEKGSAMDASEAFRLRRCLLTTLYESFRSMPYLQLEPEQLCLACTVPLEQLNWNLVYLEKCGYVELSKTHGPADQVASAVSITVAGIDLVENDAEFGKRFP